MTDEPKSVVKQNEIKDNTSSVVIKKPIDSMSDEEIIAENLKELLEKKSREERKANGRLIAVIVAFLVIFLAIYHAWIRKTAVLAGVLVPAVIMLSYGLWVVVLAKRDKRKRALFEKHIEEVTLKYKTELLEKAKQVRKCDKKHPGETKLHFENEIPPKQRNDTAMMASTSRTATGGHRKHRKQRGRHMDGDSGSCSSGSVSSTGSGRHLAAHYATKEFRVKRPSIRQKIFRQNATAKLLVVPGAGGESTKRTGFETKKKRLQRLDALVVVPHMVRMGSAP